MTERFWLAHLARHVQVGLAFFGAKRRVPRRRIQGDDVQSAFVAAAISFSHALAANAYLSDGQP